MDAGSADPRGARHYPESLEVWWTEEAVRSRRAHSPAQAIAGLVPAARALGDRFTTDRPATFVDYWSGAALPAYGITYFPRAWVRARFPVVEAIEWRGWAPEGDDVRILDLGAGPGAAGLGVAHLLAARFPSARIALEARDRSRAALAPVKPLADALALPRLSVETRVASLDPPDDRRPFDVVVVSLAVNEAFEGDDPAPVAAWMRALVQRLAPRGLLLVVEPALERTARRLQSAADAVLAADDAHAWGPFFGPLAPAAPGPFWPHEVRRWTPPRTLVEINRRLVREIKVLRFSYALLGRAPGRAVPASPDVFRLTSPVDRTKAFFRWTGVAGDGRTHAYEMQRRDARGDDAHLLQRLERGDIVVGADLRPLRDPPRVRIPDLAAIRETYHPS